MPGNPFIGTVGTIDEVLLCTSMNPSPYDATSRSFLYSKIPFWDLYEEIFG